MIRSWLKKMGVGSAAGTVVSAGPAEVTSTIRFNPASYADPAGRVFEQDGRIFRAIPAPAAAFCRSLFDRGVVAQLVERGLLVDTEISERSLPGYALVLEHARVTHVTYPYEWSGEMLRAAALHTLDLIDALSPWGLGLKDAHGWNVLFEGVRPKFVDFGSLVERDTQQPWVAEQEFRDYFLHPLELMAIGQGRAARAYLRDFDTGVRESELLAFREIVAEGRPQLGQAMPTAWYRGRIQDLRLSPAKTDWSAYYANEFPALTPNDGWTLKHKVVHELLEQYRPATVLDIGANRGWYAQRAALSGAKVIAFDNDEVSIGQLFNDARQAGLEVQPLVMSYVNPSPLYGIAGGFMAPASERMRCELVLGLALVHHMVFKMHLKFEQIAAGLALYTDKVLIVEFPPAEDFYVNQWMTSAYAWYTPANFRAELQKHFGKIAEVASHPAPRLFFVCERKRS